MKVVFDARYLTAKASGVGTYQKNLIRALLVADENIRLQLITRDHGVAAKFESPRCTEWVYDVEPRSFRTLLELSIRLRKLSFDLYHGTFNLIPHGLNRPKVVTIHDIMPIQKLANMDPRLSAQYTAGLFWRYGMTLALHRADRILTISKASRDAILNRFSGMSPEKIVISPLAVDRAFFEPVDKNDLARVQQTLGFNNPYVLIVGQESPYKNHVRAVQSFMMAASEAPELRLVMVHRTIRHNRVLRALVSRPDVKSKVVVLGQVEQGLLRALFQEAHIFFQPSLVEGFGLPILEAMAARCPVVTSNLSAPAEVAGNAAVKVSPYDEAEMMDALLRVHGDTKLRKQLIRAGEERARQFSWSRTADQTLKAYRVLLRHDFVSEIN